MTNKDNSSENKNHPENYEKMLSDAFTKVKSSLNTACDRFELKKVEGHIEGNKTIIDNFSQIALCLRRDSTHLAKFLFKELATYGEILGDRLVFTSKLSSKQISEKLEMYANLYVICPNCGKPDTEVVEEGEKKFLRCLACGTKSIIISDK
jgi:translation initiation factor 2 subunit 2